MGLAELLEERHVSCERIASYLDTLDHGGRVAAMRALPRASQKRLYDAVAGFCALHLEDLVPAAMHELAPVRHEGINNMLLARRFAKVMYRQPSGVIAGYNAQTWQALTGPGYFTARQAGLEVVIDYNELPRSTPPGWPRVRSNARGLSFFVYRNLEDTLRAVSHHVTIGRAARGGRDLPNYFILVRTEVSEAARGDAQLRSA